jgi:predicted dehydrogenase
VKKINVGVVGCGQIAQIMHLPYLKELPQFELAALCDASATVVDGVGDLYGVGRRYTDYRELLAQDDIDVVAVLTMYHTDIAVAAAETGKHVFVEKPLCFDPAEGDRVLDAVRRNNVKLMVGYMKRYDPGYEYGAALMRAMEDVRLISVHDFGGDFFWHQSLYSIIKGDDVPPKVLAEGQAAVEASTKAAVGSGHEHLSDLYWALLMLSSHDLTILRGAFGAPDGVSYSQAISPTELLSVLDYGENRSCVFKMGLWTDYLWWDERLTAYGRDKTVSIEFPNPYLKNAPTTVTVEENENGSPTRKLIPASYQEPFRREWMHFYECISEGREPLTNGSDAKADVELAIEMIRAVR